jgi:DNA-binding transcriptional MerR regulator
MATEFLTIGHLARATATKVETIRFYEKTGLLPAPARTSGNYRAYGTEHLNRLSFIRRARDLGFSIEQIRALLGLSDHTDQPCEAIDAIAREHLEAVDRSPGASPGARPYDRSMQVRYCRRVPDHRSAVAVVHGSHALGAKVDATRRPSPTRWNLDLSRRFKQSVAPFVICSAKIDSSCTVARL